MKTRCGSSVAADAVRVRARRSVGAGGGDRANRSSTRSCARSSTSTSRSVRTISIALSTRSAPCSRHRAPRTDLGELEASTFTKGRRPTWRGGGRSPSSPPGGSDEDDVVRAISCRIAQACAAVATDCAARSPPPSRLGFADDESDRAPRRSCAGQVREARERLFRSAGGIRPWVRRR